MHEETHERAGERRRPGDRWPRRLRAAGALAALLAAAAAAEEPNRDLFGLDLARYPDLDGDGFDDLLVSNPSYDPEEGIVDAGGVWLVSSASGAVLAALEGRTPHGWAGLALACVDDLDGDGAAEVVVVGFDRDRPDGPEGDRTPGEARVVSPCSGAELWSFPCRAVVDWVGPVPSPVCVIGDVDGHGKRDLVVLDALPTAPAGPPELVVSAKSLETGTDLWSLRDAREWRQLGAGARGAACSVVAIRLTAVEPPSRGTVDVAVAARLACPSGATGDSTPASTLSLYSGASGACSLSVPLADPGVALSMSSTSGVDLDGDGAPDLLGAPGTPSHTVGAYSGATGERLRTWSVPAELEERFWDGPADFGQELVLLDDYDGDGNRDLLVTSPRGLSGWGAPSLTLVVSTREDRVLGTAEADTFTEGDFGVSAVYLGDVTGDGVGDFAISSQTRRGNLEGAVRIHSGATLEVVRRLTMEDVLARDE